MEDKSKRRMSFFKKDRPKSSAEGASAGTPPASSGGMRAAEMKMTDAQRIAVMELVRAGTLTVDEAMQQVLQTETELAKGGSPAATTSAATTAKGKPPAKGGNRSSTADPIDVNAFAALAAQLEVKRDKAGVQQVPEEPQGVAPPKPEPQAEVSAGTKAETAPETPSEPPAKADAADATPPHESELKPSIHDPPTRPVPKPRPASTIQSHTNASDASLSSGEQRGPSKEPRPYEEVKNEVVVITPALEGYSNQRFVTLRREGKLGLHIATADGMDFPRVLKVVPGAAADGLGCFEAGDSILNVNGFSMRNKRSEDVVNVIRTRPYIEMMIAVAANDVWRKEIEAAARRLGISDIKGLKASELNLSNEDLLMVMSQVKDGRMTIDQALEQVKARHLKQQEEKALEAQRKAEAAKAAAEARRKKKPKKIYLDASRILFQAKVLKDSKPTEEDDDLLRVGAGERVNVIDDDEDDVYECEFNGKIGFIKRRNLQKLDGPLVLPKRPGATAAPEPESAASAMDPELEALMAAAAKAQEEAAQAMRDADSARTQLEEIRTKVAEMQAHEQDGEENLDAHDLDADDDDNDDVEMKAEIENDNASAPEAAAVSDEEAQ
ncbi:uncharacterized protein MONBRDRAFT_8750 [Monosiga brevicollis MX1]|uniref:PDZ domain-containing protein n=1 Tax=Monosiga brevicollis TaxID=81824 RepID=A9V111_MONBE|nr:uncharacterized protein MONBRDRAFT_8750 [Monosiga brevicollis MX1]EDQ88726.1 predicted protein [Monosiga brevicollis MX1]|eukprot:XP_001746339.1 hypothetical protein [Monosiga brevicollis MX1]